MSPPSGFSDTIILKNVDSSLSIFFTAPFPDTVTEANIKYLTGGDSLSSSNPAGCVYANVPVTVPGTCDTTLDKTYNFKPICNAGAPNGIAIVCSPGNSTTDAVFVGDNGNANPLQITSQLYEDSTTVSSINICKKPFAIRYKLWNPASANHQLPQNSNKKHLTDFTLQIDTAWINIYGLNVTYFPPIGPSITETYTADSIGVSVNLVGDSLNDSTAAYIQFSGMEVNFSNDDIDDGPNSCSPPSARGILGNDSITYETNCGNPFMVTSGIRYMNNVGVVPSGNGATLNGHNNDMVSPGEDPVLNFGWQQIPQNGNPWNFSPPTVSGDSTFFQCPTVIYKAILTLPSIITMGTDTFISYKDGNDSMYILPLSPLISGGWEAVLPGPGFGNNVIMSVQVHLGDCPDNFPGGLFSPTLSLSAICEDGTCSTSYCFETLSNTVSVHCGGRCNNTGIGTVGMTIHNVYADTAQAAYACDMLDFNIAGQGYSGSPIGIDSTKNIFLLLTYPAYPGVLGRTDAIFDRAAATATYSYLDSIGIPIPLASISNPTYSAGQWSIRISINDTAACRAIRRTGNDTFYLDLKMPVECTLNANSTNQGIYPLNGINAIFAIDGTVGTDTSYSCDGVTGNFLLLAHQYGTKTAFLPLDSGANPCSQTMTVTDSAIYGDPISPEMPGYVRPIISWPTDGRFTISYPLDMSIQHLGYIDSSGQTYTDSIYDTTILLNGSRYQTKVYGFKYAPDSLYWPAYSKVGPKFLRELVVHFSQTGCGSDTVFDTLPHLLTTPQCALTACNAFTKSTTHPVSLSNTSVISLTQINTTQNVAIVSPLMTRLDTVTFVVNNTSSLGTNSIFIEPNATSLSGLSSNQLSSLTLNGAALSMGNFTQLPSDTLQFIISIDTQTCKTQTILLPVGYSCSGTTPDSGNFCGKDTLAKINITVKEPQISWTSSITTDYFPNIKGICRGDSLKWNVVMSNAGGPAYEPVFSLADVGPGYIDIAKIVFMYTQAGGHYVASTSYAPPANTYTNLYIGDFSQAPLLSLGLPQYQGRVYLLPGDDIQATIYVFGDGENCSAYAAMQANFSCKDVCNLVATPPTPLVQDFYFNTASNAPDSCTGNYIGQDSHPWVQCNPCDYGTPLSIISTVTNPSCHNNSGIISLQVGDGPAAFDSVSGGGYYGFQTYGYAWNNGDTTSVVHNLGAGTYIVTVSDLGCDKIDTFKLNNSGLSISNQITPVTCYGGSDGSIKITASGDTTPYFYHWTGSIGTNSNNTDSLINLKAGTYAVTITSSAHYPGCPDSSVQVFSVTQPTQPTRVILSGTDIGCTNNPGSVTISGITPPFSGPLSYHWNNGDTTSQIFNLSAGVYVVTVTENGQCTASANDTIIHVSTGQIGNSPSVTAFNICYGRNEQAKVYATGFSSGTDTVFYTIGYSSNNLPPYGHDTTYKGTVTFDNTGTGTLNIPGGILYQSYYQIVIDSIKLSSSCSAIAPAGMNATFTVTHIGLDTITLAPNGLLSPQTVCASDTFNLIAKSLSGGQYTWSATPLPNPNYTISQSRFLYQRAPASGGSYTYRVVFTSASGCTDTASFIANIDNHVATAITPANPLACNSGATMILTASKAPAGVTYTYQWNPTPNATADSTATYTAHDTAYSVAVKVTDTNNCSALATARIAVDTFYVWINPDSAAACVGGRVYLTASAGTPVSTYHWSNNDSTSTAAFNISANTVYAVTVTDTHGCSVADTSGVTVDIPAVIITTIPATGCDSGVAVANVTQGIGTNTYLWSNGVNLASDSGLSLGMYMVTITDQINCTAADTVNITTSFLELHIAIVNSCGDSSGTATAVVTAGTSPISYLWNTGDTTVSIMGLGAGIYSVTATHAMGCSASASATILQADSVLSVNQDFYYPDNCHNLDSGAILVAIYGGAQPYSYHWSNGAATQNLANVSNGNYYETITDAYGCQVAAGGLYSYSPVAINLVSITPACKPGSYNNGIIVITASGGGYHLPPDYSFAWSHGDSSSVYLGTSRDSLYDLSPGSYTITVTQTGANLDSLPVWSCNAIATFNVDTLPNISFTGPNVLNSCISQTISVSANTNMAGPIYHWSDSATTQSVSIETTGNYNVTITNSVGCSVTGTDTITATSSHLCCFLNLDSINADSIINLSTDTVWSDTLHIGPHRNVYISPGTVLIVNSTLTLQQCQVVLGNNSQISVYTDDTLNILGSTLKGCDTMWSGIYVTYGAAINVDEYGSTYSVIEGSMNGIAMQSYLAGTKAMFRHTNFYNNQTSITFTDYIPHDNYVYDVSNCYFGMDSTETMLPAPHGHQNYTHPLAGVVVQWSVPIDVTMGFLTQSLPNPYIGGGPNTFKNLNCGIAAQNCILNLYANTFDSIRNFEGQGGFNYGAAIAATKSSGSSIYHVAFGNLTVRTAPSLPDSSSTIHFQNCDYGIKANGVTLSAANNRMENVTNGVFVENSGGVIVDSNYIHNTAYGISLINNSGATQLVDTNVIYVAATKNILYISQWEGYNYVTYDTVYGTTYAKTYGIEETELTSSSTTIKHNAIYRGLNCIELNNAHNTLIADNYLHLANDSAVAGNQAGLYAANCTDLLISDNICDGDSDYYAGTPDTASYITTRYRKSGLSFFNSSGDLCENTLAGTTHSTGLGYGMLYAGTCTGIQLYSNTINQSWYGITLKSVGTAQVIDPQPSTSNTYQNNDFVGNFNSVGNYATYSYLVAGNYNVPIFYYSSTQGSTYQPSLANNGTTINSEEIKFSSIIGGAPESCTLIHALPPQTGEGTFARIIAEDSARYYMVPGIDSIAANWLVSKMLYESLYSDTAVLNNDSLMSAFYTQEDTVDIGAIFLSEQQNQLLTDSATLADTTSSDGKPSGYSDAISNANYLNGNISDANVQASNYKAMSDIYINTVIAGIDTFSSAQINTIESLAAECPFWAGDAVYMARSLYTMIDNTVFFNDMVLCQPSFHGSERMMRVNKPTDTAMVPINPLEFVHLYPNPAKEVINLSFYAQTQGSVEFELIDQLGQSVIKQGLGNGQSFAQFATGRLSNGLYHWKLTDSNRTIKAGTVAIMK